MPLQIEQFRRAVRIEAGNVKVETLNGADGLRVSFVVERDTKPYPNAAGVEIYNLAPETRAKLVGRELPVRISAGYGDNPIQVFLGVMREGRNERRGTDIVTVIDAGDGEEKPDVATINRSFAKGTPVSVVLQALISASGLKSGNVSDVSTAKLTYGTILTRGLTISGPVSEELQGFCRSLGITWSIQDGAFQFLHSDTPYTKRQGPKISRETGLVEYPRIDIDKDGKRIIVGKALLLPDLLPGTRFQLESEPFTGALAARKVRHYGDTHGNEWYVDFEATEIK